ncbi:MAG: phosphosulfolactate synthase [Deltaproteobacteria bacterium]|nr:phosphosulfolactate synthase [Deltaproteobacteria bacterium]
MNFTQMLTNFQDQLTKDAGRTAKPRREGITMVLVFDVVNRGPAYIRPFSKLIDRVKLLDTMWHDDLSTVAKYVQEFRELNIDVAFGGTQFEVAKAQGKMSEYLTLLTQLGVNEIEVENHASGATLEETKDEIKMLKDRNFTVVGELGKKWAWKDPTRKSRDLIFVDKVLEQALSMVEAGADYIYWEGMVVRNLIGTQLENLEGQKQFLDVVRQVHSDRFIFEIWDARGQPNTPIISWLVKELGPNVNLANIFPEDVKFVEWIRNGIIYEMDHPYMRWSQDRSVAKHWWQMESPDYSIDMQRNFSLKK